MRLKLPATCQGVELTDLEKVVANLLQLIAYEDRTEDWHRTEYYFNRADIGKLVNTTPITKSNLTEVFYIGKLNEHTLSFRFLNPQKNGLGHPAYYEDSISDHRAVMLHMFILGRFSNPSNLFSEAKLHTKEQTRANTYAVHYLRDKF